MAVFCGSQKGNESIFTTHTNQIGKILAEKNINIVYGGADRGLMAVVANAGLDAKGTVIGVLPQLLSEIELQHKGLTELYVVDNMHTRKQMLFNKCDAAIVLPGGFGTLDELFEALTLIQTGKIYQFPVILFGRHYWAGLVRWITSRLVGEGKISPGDLDLVLLTDDPAEAAQAVIDAHAAQAATKATIR